MIRSDAYLAGIFDGEGYISAYVNKQGQWTMRCGVGMASRQIIEMFLHRFGGHIHKRKKLTVGGLQLWEWYITSSKSIEFLQFVIKDCVIKGKQAKLALPIAKSMERYVSGIGRKGISLSSGKPAISDKEFKIRTNAFTLLKSLNGARSRFN